MVQGMRGGRQGASKVLAATGFLGENLKHPSKKPRQGWLYKGRMRCGQQGTANIFLRAEETEPGLLRYNVETSGDRTCLKGRIFFFFDQFPTSR